MELSDILLRAERYSNWGRWGDTDQRGALNFIGPDEIRRAAALVREGRTYSLAMPFERDGAQPSTTLRTNPVHVMLKHGGDVLMAGQFGGPRVAFTDDAVYMPLQCGTQWDSLAHVFFDGRMYNDYGPEWVTCEGAARNAITVHSDRLVARGVLLDVAAHHRVDALADGYAITASDLGRCAADQNVEIGRGDIVLVRTGHLEKLRREGRLQASIGAAPGLSIDATDFLCPRDVAAVAMDTYSTEVSPPEVPEIATPMHVILLVHAGMLLGELFHLQELAAACAADGCYEFLLVAPPLPVSGGVGSPANPQAIR